MRLIGHITVEDECEPDFSRREEKVAAPVLDVITRKTSNPVQITAKGEGKVREVPSLKRIMQGEAYFQNFNELASVIKGKIAKKKLRNLINGGITQRQSFDSIKKILKSDTGSDAL